MSEKEEIQKENINLQSKQLLLISIIKDLLEYFPKCSVCEAPATRYGKPSFKDGLYFCDYHELHHLNDIRSRIQNVKYESLEHAELVKEAQDACREGD